MKQAYSIAAESSQTSFKSFVLNDPGNRQFLKIAVFATVLQFILFKLLYPFPDFFSDSYSYIYAADTNLDISIWPIGYSKFLFWFHSLTHSDTALVAFQYFLLESAAAYFFFSFLFFYRPGKTSRNILFLFLFLNPLFLYVSNYVNSDPIFAALSLLWITELIWIIHRPKTYQIFTQALLFFACFSVRNNAYYYPLITTITFLLSPQSRWRKLSGIILGLVLTGSFIVYERNAAFRLTGVHQFSLFTGWQLGNNALYFYDRIEVDSTKLPTAATRELDGLSKEFVKSIPANFKYREYLQQYVGNYFIRQPESPLKRYLWSHYPVREYNQAEGWGKVSVVFADYGSWLIKHYPIAFGRYFILPNIRNYFLPPLEKLETYNLGLNEVPFVVQDWFNYKTPDIWSVSKTAQAKILFILPPLFLLFNLILIGTLLGLLFQRKGLEVAATLKKTLWLNIVLLISNFVFSIVATINVFRYQLFPMILFLSTSLLLIDLLDKSKSTIRWPLLGVRKKTIEVELANQYNEPAKG